MEDLKSPISQITTRISPTVGLVSLIVGIALTICSIFFHFLQIKQVNLLLNESKPTFDAYYLIMSHQEFINLTNKDYKFNEQSFFNFPIYHNQVFDDIRQTYLEGTNTSLDDMWEKRKSDYPLADYGEYNTDFSKLSANITKGNYKMNYRSVTLLVITQTGKRAADNVRVEVNDIKLNKGIYPPNLDSLDGDDIENQLLKWGEINKEILYLDKINTGEGIIIPLCVIDGFNSPNVLCDSVLANQLIIPKRVLWTDSYSKQENTSPVRSMINPMFLMAGVERLG